MNIAHSHFQCVELDILLARLRDLFGLRQEQAQSKRSKALGELNKN